MRYARLAREPIPQSEPLDERQVENHAGGYVYRLDCWARLRRFLILGSDSNTYYQDAKQLTRETSRCVTDCFNADPLKTVAEIVEVSHRNLAPRNDSSIFALALGSVHPDVKARQLALNALRNVCRTFTHLAQFIECHRALGGGFGRATKRAVAGWYSSKELPAVAYQAIKYRNREGYSHQRVLELSHAPSPEAPRRALYRWIKGKETGWTHDGLPAIVRAHLDAMNPFTNTSELVDLVREHDLPWEALPTQAKTSPEVWLALLPKLGMTAMIRELGHMTQCGALRPLSTETADICHRLTGFENLQKGRIHPFTLLQALVAYRAGKSYFGRSEWTPIPQIVAALEEAFYLSFGALAPTGRKHLLAIDVSSSMCQRFANSWLTVAEAAAAMAMATMRAEKQVYTFGFATNFRDLGLTPQMSLKEVLQRTTGQNFGGTDCAVPMLHALNHKLEVDTFVVYTDNETWAGSEHPKTALQWYRREVSIAAKLVVVGMTATDFSIADPDDPGMLDVVGFDSSAPAVIADFTKA